MIRLIRLDSTDSTSRVWSLWYLLWLGRIQLQAVPRVHFAIFLNDESDFKRHRITESIPTRFNSTERQSWPRYCLEKILVNKVEAEELVSYITSKSKWQQQTMGLRKIFHWNVLELIIKFYLLSEWTTYRGMIADCIVLHAKRSAGIVHENSPGRSLA